MGNKATVPVKPDVSPNGQTNGHSNGHANGNGVAVKKAPRERPCCLPCFPGAERQRPVAKGAGPVPEPQLAEPSAPAVVIVDPYSSGRFLVYELAPKYHIICVRSSNKLGSFWTKVYESHKAYFAETIDYENMSQLLAALKSLTYKNIIGVFAGSEPGVELADELAEVLNMPARNDVKLTLARKDKAAMQDRLRECGVPSADQIKSGNLNELVEWAKARNRWPLVAKPLGSCCSDGIHFLQNVEDLEMGYSEIIGKVNPNGKFNAELALQEFLAGDEYIVDTVSYAGKHLCCAVWVYTKRKGTPWNPHCILSEGNRLLEASGEIQDRLVSYVFRVLDAVGFNYGPCHTEVMLTARGPILVEVNARMHGLQGPYLIGLSTGTSKATYAMDALAEGGQLIQKRLKEATTGTGRYLYPLQKHCLQFVLISPVCGYLATSIANKIQELNLPSVIEILPAVQKGQYLQQSCDLHTAAGYVLMVHESAAQVEADRLAIRRAEENGRVYKVSQQPIPGSPLCSPKSPSSAYSSPRMQSVEKAEELWAENDDADIEFAMHEVTGG